MVIGLSWDAFRFASPISYGKTSKPFFFMLQEKLRVAVLVSKAAFQFIQGEYIIFFFLSV